MSNLSHSEREDSGRTGNTEGTEGTDDTEGTDLNRTFNYSGEDEPLCL